MLLQKFLAVLADVQNNIGTVFLLVYLLNRVSWIARTRPLNRLAIFFIRFGDHLYFVCYHEGRVKTQTKVSNNRSLLFVFFYKLRRRRKCHLIQVLQHFFLCHTNSAIGNRQRFGICINQNTNSRIRYFLLYLAASSQGQ